MEVNNSELSPAALKLAMLEKDGEAGQFSLLEFLNIMLAFWWLIVILAVVVGGGTYAYSKLTSIPEYTSEGTLYIDTAKASNSDDVDAVAIKNAATILPTYIKVLESIPFLETVSNDIDNKYDASAILKMISYEAVEETNLIAIEVVTEDSHDAYLIAKSIMRNAPTKIAQVFEGGSVKVIEYPQEASEPKSDSSLKLGIIGFVMGAAIAMLIIFMINMFDTRVKNSEELTAKYGMPILGEIPNLLDV